MKKKPNRRAMPVTITIRPELLATVDQLADAQNMTRSQFIARQIERGIEQERMMVTMMSDKNVASMVTKVFGNADALRAMGKALKHEVDEKQLEVFNRGFEQLQQAAEDVVPKTKGKKS